MTKIDVFSGFLGAGKTTLIRKLIEQAYKGQKVVLIENEFGEIAVDGGFLKDAGIEITEMNSGCICCSLVGDFSKALKQVLTDYKPDRILIEPSGVGKLSDVIKAVSDVLNKDVILNSTTTIVDASKCKMYKRNFGEFFNNQVENAGCVVLSRTKTLNSSKISEAVDIVKSLNERAVVITTDWDKLDGSEILSAMEHKSTLTTMINEMKNEDACPVCGHHHHEHENDDHDNCECGHNHNHEHHHHDNCDCEHHHKHEHHHDHEHHHEGCSCGCEHDHEHHHHADEVFTDWGCETSKKYTQEEISFILNELDNSKKYGTVLRAKGFVESDNEFIYFDYVPGESNVRQGKPTVTGRICVIGSGLKEDELKTLFGIID